MKIFIPLAISKAASHKEQIKTQILRSYSKDSSISFDEINESTAKKLGWIP